MYVYKKKYPIAQPARWAEWWKWWRKKKKEIYNNLLSRQLHLTHIRSLRPVFYCCVSREAALSLAASQDGGFCRLTTRPAKSVPIRRRVRVTEQTITLGPEREAPKRTNRRPVKPLKPSFFKREIKEPPSTRWKYIIVVRLIIAKSTWCPPSWAFQNSI